MTSRRVKPDVERAGVRQWGERRLLAGFILRVFFMDANLYWLLAAPSSTVTDPVMPRNRNRIAECLSVESITPASEVVPSA